MVYLLYCCFRSSGFHSKFSFQMFLFNVDTCFKLILKMFDIILHILIKYNYILVTILFRLKRNKTDKNDWFWHDDINYILYYLFFCQKTVTMNNIKNSLKNIACYYNNAHIKLICNSYNFWRGFPYNNFIVLYYFMWANIFHYIILLYVGKYQYWIA